MISLVLAIPQITMNVALTVDSCKLILNKNNIYRVFYLVD